MDESEVRRVYLELTALDSLSTADAYHISKAIAKVRSELRDASGLRENIDESPDNLNYYAAAIAFLSQQRMQRGNKITLATRLVLAYRSAAAPFLKYMEENYA